MHDVDLILSIHYSGLPLGLETLRNPKAVRLCVFLLTTLRLNLL